MTCLMSRICAQADGCNIHDRYTLEKCSAFKEKQTNFSRITASPEALAEFIDEVLKCCEYNDNCAGCPLDWRDQICNKNGIIEWLKQESK